MCDQENKFTVIHQYAAPYSMQYLTQMRRIELREGESVVEMLEREDLSPLYIFHGHPKLEGE